jgi:hypothetical protein
LEARRKTGKYVPGSNATTTPVIQHLAPIKCYKQLTGVAFPEAKGGETMDTYIHYGGNVAVGSYPAMANEGCLPFHFGIVKTGEIGGNNACFIKFHGGQGDFITNGLVTILDSNLEDHV